LEQFYDGVMRVALIVSIPEREKMLERTVKSLRNQVDEIRVSLNEYSYVPSFLNEKEVVLLDNALGDAGKFYFANKFKGYILTCDDDLIYPKGYVDFMCAGVDKYKCICTLHGRKYSRPVVGFQNSFIGFPCLGDVLSDVIVDVGGDGVMCYHTDYFNISYNDFYSKNMSQLWVAKKAISQGVKIMVLAHRVGYLEYMYPEWTIWDEASHSNFREQTKLLKSFLK